MGGTTYEDKTVAQAATPELSFPQRLESLRWQRIPVGSDGFVALVDVMGEEAAVVQAARVCYGEGTKSVSDDRALLRYLMRHRHCYHPDMEVLTADGWKKWSDCGYVETFMVPTPQGRTLHPETLPLEVFDADEEMQTFKSQRMSYCVTGDHRMWFKGKYAADFEIVRAGQMPRWGHFDPQAGYRYSAAADTPPDALGQLIGFALGDGSWSGAGLTFHLRKERKKAYLRDLLARLSLVATESQSSTYADATLFYIPAADVRRSGVLHWIDVGERAADKHLREIPDDPAVLAGVFDGLVNSDGHTNTERNDRVEFSSVSPRLLKNFELLATAHGYDCHASAQAGRLVAYPAGRTTLEARAQYFGTRHYAGKVFCATTSTGLLMVRGGPREFGFVCGNTTPFEMCLHGDSRIPTFPCAGAAVKTYTIREIADAFERGGKENSWVKLLRIRTVNPATGVVTATRIKRAWKTGRKPVYRVEVETPFRREIVVTDNHPFLCPDGAFRNVTELQVGNQVMLNGVPATAPDVIAEIRRRRAAGEPLSAVAAATGVSKSAVYSYAPGRAKRKTGFTKKPTGARSDPRAIARRRSPGHQCAVPGCDAVGVELHHIDENPHNNAPDNLRRLCRRHHKHAHTLTRLEKAVAGTISAITLVGHADVFDLEVEDANHTFVADGFVVHNCELKFMVRVPMDCWRQWVRLISLAA